MESLLVIAGLFTIGAITPGPNNLAVMREAARRGWRGALHAGVGIVFGGLTLLVLVASGVGALFGSVPLLAHVMTIVCCLLLVGFGVGLLKQSFESKPQERRHRLSSLQVGAAGLYAFQFINPKAWSLMLTVTSVAGSARKFPDFLPQLTILFVFISVLCLVLWAAIGFSLSGWLSRIRVRKWFDGLTGVAFMGFALILLIAVFQGGN